MMQDPWSYEKTGPGGYDVYYCGRVAGCVQKNPAGQWDAFPRGHVEHDTKPSRRAATIALMHMIGADLGDWKP